MPSVSVGLWQVEEYLWIPYEEWDVQDEGAMISNRIEWSGGGHKVIIINTTVMIVDIQTSGSGCCRDIEERVRGRGEK